MKRLLLLTTLSLAACLAPAQGIMFEDESELAYEQIMEAYFGLARQRSFSFKIEVTESTSALNSRRGTVVGSVIFDTPQASNVLRLQVSEYSGHMAEAKSLMRRIVADGSRFYIYDAASNSYSVGSYEGETRTRKFFSLLDKAAGNGPLSLLSRLASQVYGSPRPMFRNWLPGSRMQPAGRKDSTIFMIQPLPGGGEKSVALESPLTRIMYTERLGANPLNSPQITWNMLLGWNAGTLGSFEFRPPLNAKQVSGGQ